MASSLMDTAVEAIMASYETSSEEIQHNASNWLSRFLEDEASWTVWRQLLSHQVPHIRFFAANALTQKIRSFWDSLAEEFQGELKDELLSLACRTMDDDTLQHRLSMALAAIAVRTIQSAWHLFWQDMTGIFQVGLDSFISGCASSPNGPPSIPLPSQFLTPHLYYSRLTVLNIIACLPTELERCVFMADRISSVYQALGTGTPSMLHLAQHVLELPPPAVAEKQNMTRSGSAPPGLLHTNSSQSGHSLSRSGHHMQFTTQVPTANAMSLKIAALNALHAWLLSSHASTSSPLLSLRNIVQSRTDLLPLLFEALKCPRLSIEAGEILLAILTRRSSESAGSMSTGGLSSAFTSASRLAQTSLQQQDPVVITAVLSQLLGLVDCYREATASLSANIDEMSRFDAKIEENMRLCKAIVLLFVGVGEANVSLLANSLNVTLVQDFLTVLLEMTSHPQLDIAELGMQFWNSLEYTSCGNGDFSGYYQQLMNIILRQCIHPPSDTAYLLSNDADVDFDAESFLMFRESAVQSLRACYSVLGDQCMAYLQDLVDQAGQSGTYDVNQWRQLELAYFAATSFNLHVPPDAPLVSQLMRIAFSLPVDISQQTHTFTPPANQAPRSRSFPATSNTSSAPSTYHSGFQSRAQFHQSAPHSHLEDGGTANALHSTASTNPHGLSPSSSSSYTISAGNSPMNTARGERTENLLATVHDTNMPPALLVSVARFIGEYRFWLMQQSEPLELLEPALCTCLHWAGSPNSELAFSASVAFKDLSVSSSSILVPFLPSIIEKYNGIYDHLRSEDRVTLTTGLIAILHNSASNEEIVTALQYLWTPCANHLKALLDTNLNTVTDIVQLTHAVSAEIESIATMVTLKPSPTASSILRISALSTTNDYHLYGSPSSNAPGFSTHPLVTALLAGSDSDSATIWNLLDQTAQIWCSAPSPLVVEKLNLTYANLLQSCQESFEPLLPTFLSRCSYLFQKRPTPSGLQAISLAIQYFGRDSDTLFAFSKLMLDISQTVCDQITGEHATQKEFNPDLLSAYFGLCSTILGINPDILVSSNGAEILSVLIHICLQAVSTDYPELFISALHVFDKLLFGRHVLEREAWREFVASTIDNLGGDILQTLIRYIITAQHHKARLIVSTVLHKLIQGYSIYARQRLSQILAQEESPGNLFTPDEKERVVNIFLGLGSSILFRQFLNDFADVANHRAELDVFNTYEVQISQSLANATRTGQGLTQTGSTPHIL